MEKLAKEAIPAMLPVKGGRDTKLRLMLLQLEIGEGLFMPKADWQRKNPPYKIVSHIKKTHGYIFEYGMKHDDSGWLFRRIK